VVREERLVGCEILVLGGREEREGRFEGGGMEGLDVEGVCVDLEGLSACFREVCRWVWYAFFILARKKLRTRNLNRSSSVCMIINLKFVLGSMLPVWFSTSSIWLRH
jgi:hypothetical protein